MITLLLLTPKGLKFHIYFWWLCQRYWLKNLRGQVHLSPFLAYLFPLTFIFLQTTNQEIRIFFIPQSKIDNRTSKILTQFITLALNYTFPIQVFQVPFSTQSRPEFPPHFSRFLLKLWYKIPLCGSSFPRSAAADLSRRSFNEDGSRPIHKSAAAQAARLRKGAL